MPVSKRRKNSWLSKALVVLFILFVLFVLLGFIGSRGSTGLQGLDRLAGVSVFQSAHDRMVGGVKSAYAWGRSLVVEAKQEVRGQKSEEGKKKRNVMFSRQPGVRQQGNGKPGPDGKPKIILEKRESGQTIRRLQTLQKPLGNPSESDQKALDKVIKEKTKE